MSNETARIAFVDDDLRVLEGVRRNMRGVNKGWAVEFFSSPLELLAAFEKKPFDVVISDMRMPEMSGLELIEEVRLKSSAPCIILTGSPDLTSALYAINKADVFRFYTKPCDSDLLVEGIEAALAYAQENAAPEIEIDRLASQIGLVALDRLSLGVVVADRDGQVIFTNKSAGETLAAGDGLMVCSGNKCRASESEDTKALVTLIGEVIDKPIDDLEDTAAISITRPSMKRPYSVFVSPLEFQDGASNQRQFAALFVSDPDQLPIPTAEHLMRLYDLSRSQALIVQNLALGMRVEEAAQEAGVTVSTARTYLKQVFSKTDTSRQSELLKLVLASPRVLAA